MVAPAPIHTFSATSTGAPARNRAALGVVDRVAAGDEHGSRADHHALADPDSGVVQERAALVDEGPLGKVQAEPVIGVERRVEPAILS
jgi:hypothetical protein